MPATLPQIVPYLYYPNATEALEFLVKAFGFVEQSAIRDADGVVWTAQLRTGSGVVMIGPAMDEFGSRCVAEPDWATSRVHVLVEDLDAHYERAVAAGAVIRSQPAEHIGDVKLYVAGDCGGQQWIFAQPIAA